MRDGSGDMMFGSRGVAGAAILATLAAGSVVVACGKDSAAAATAASTANILTAGAHVDGNHFTIDSKLAKDCNAAAECLITIKLAAQGDYHINQQYPYKFKAADAIGIEFLGTDAAGKNVFSKSAGDFKIDDEKSATMSVRFKPAQKGNATVAGTYKMSVCSAQNCQLEQPDTSVSFQVK